ncbi:nicotinamide-nucleotide amidase [Curtobacterium luteum]|uniref:Competence damage-inducible protein A n=1 Tax=Curtobacterium luteum TaxID=33881 RepID=A0A8H9GDR1_9MICO|nr:nicotinamide-nucleotide amidohydrolase family protein [Curtobacterium luteum]MBM7801025.1 nicotinamide-nucleotide amidase [Curtobacterium luteum]NUU50642.1 nicotinamide-nucleotide amidohydrolase family protein [Curtobacterium luteum]GGL05983.1 competence damage-inducible protein A [Curtobacterium luteum]
MTTDVDGSAREVVAALTARGETVAVAESLTGGLVVATLVGVPGASAVVRGGVVAYATPVKHTVLGVEADLLAERGAVDPEVARQMAAGVRSALSVDGEPATWGISTTGVAGPDPQDGKPVGTVFVGIASAERAVAWELHLSGDRTAIREGTVSELLARMSSTANGALPTAGE